jgi:hypothetical protein
VVVLLHHALAIRAAGFGGTLRSTIPVQQALKLKVATIARTRLNNFMGANFARVHWPNASAKKVIFHGVKPVLRLHGQKSLANLIGVCLIRAGSPIPYETVPGHPAMIAAAITLYQVHYNQVEKAALEATARARAEALNSRPKATPAPPLQ